LEFQQLGQMLCRLNAIAASCQQTIDGLGEPIGNRRVKLAQRTCFVSEICLRIERAESPVNGAGRAHLVQDRAQAEEIER